MGRYTLREGIKHTVSTHSDCIARNHNEINVINEAACNYKPDTDGIEEQAN